MLELIQNHPAQVTLSLAIILLVSVLIARVTDKIRLPNVTGYILMGVVLGPYLLNLFPTSLINGMDFVTDVALAFIAFGVGKYFKLSELKQSGGKVIVITIFEALTAAALITLTMYFVFRLSLPFSLLLGAIGSATAPASTIMTIRQYKAKGNFVNTILQVVALDDAVALIAFSICAAISSALAGNGNSSGIQTILLPILINLLSIVLGGLLGFTLYKLLDHVHSDDNCLVLVISFLLLLTGFCTYFNISPLLGCMVMGTVFINLGGKKQLFKQLNQFSPPILIFFFVLSGIRLNLPALVTAGWIGVTYFFVRIIGKYAGAYLGSKLTHAPVEVERYLGLALIPQAGVSIGLAVLGQRILPEGLGVLLSTIILSSGVLYELVGPACAKAALFLSKSIPAQPEQEGTVQQQEPIPQQTKSPVQKEIAVGHIRENHI